MQITRFYLYQFPLYSYITIPSIYFFFIALYIILHHYLFIVFSTFQSFLLPFIFLSLSPSVYLCIFLRVTRPRPYRFLGCPYIMAPPLPTFPPPPPRCRPLGSSPQVIRQRAMGYGRSLGGHQRARKGK